MPGIREFLAEGPFKLIVAELPDGSVMLTQADAITGERHSITLSAATAYQASRANRFASHLWEAKGGVWITHRSAVETAAALTEMGL